jgi:hypothetical protein
MLAAMMGIPSQVLSLCKNLNFRIKDTSDRELSVERLGRNITSLKPSLISDSICMEVNFQRCNITKQIAVVEKSPFVKIDGINSNFKIRNPKFEDDISDFEILIRIYW